MVDKLKEYILEFAAYDLEPLHLLISALIERELCESARCVIRPILELVRDDSLECYRHSGRDGDTYEKMHILTEVELTKYIDCHNKQAFKSYPSPDEGGEYFLKTAAKGLEGINADGKTSIELYRNKKTGEMLQRHVLYRDGKPADMHPHYREPDR